MYNVKTKKCDKKSDVPTPHIVCDFLYKLLKVYKPDKILDSCAGDGRLTEKFNCEVISYEIKEGKDFFNETEIIDCDMVLFNPPFNSGNGKRLICERFLDHTIKLLKDKSIPIIMFAPMGFRLNQVKESKRWRKLRDEYPPITTIITLPLDIYDNVNFHSEIICFNTEKLKGHYFLDI